MKKTITRFLVISAFCLLALNVFMYWQQAQMTFYPIVSVQQTPADWGLAYDNVSLKTADNVQLHGWYIPHKRSAPVLLFFHGNAGNISHRRESIEIFHRLGLNIFIIDYRGYGNSQGSPDEQGIYQDAYAAWRYLTEEKGFHSEQVVIFGRSLGGAVAASLAAEVKARGLILESTFSSSRDFARLAFPFLSHILYMRYDFNTSGNIKSVNYPVLVLHSQDDKVIPFQLGNKVFQSANNNKQFVQMRGDHNSAFMLSQPKYEQALAEWLKSLK